ncbi:MAG: tRNA pseudouridine(38-40) synthase TruA [Eubacteriales bacterium]
MKFLLKLSYLGTNFNGFQVQKNGRTVQGELCAAAERIFSRRCDVSGCSRTDSGVHASEYYATVAADGETGIFAERIPRAMNTYLPPDISVSAAWAVNDDFSVRRAVSGKEYMYLIWNGESRNPFYEDRALFYPNKIDDESMLMACKAILGKHDFSAFMASGSDITDTVRTVTDCRLERDGDILKIYVSADGFLYNMVRIIVGTLLEVSEGKMSISEVMTAVCGAVRESAGRTAPACGLYLNRVFINF